MLLLIVSADFHRLVLIIGSAIGPGDVLHHRHQHDVHHLLMGTTLLALNLQLRRHLLATHSNLLSPKS